MLRSLAHGGITRLVLRRLALIGLALVAGLAVGAPAAPADVVAEQLDAAHTGVSAQGLGPPLRERWRRVFDGSVPISHEVRWPLAAQGRVFITFQNRDGGPGQLHALDPATGATLWTREVSGWLVGAAYSSGKVLLATRETLYAFDAATGTQAWSRSQWPDRSGTGLDTAPVAADGVAYVGVIGALYAVNVSDGTVKWHRELSWVAGIGVGTERVYVNLRQTLVALRRADGAQAWSAPAPDESSFLDAHPTVAGGRVYVASRYDGAVYDATSGALLRKRFWMDPLPAVDAQRAYVLSGVSAEQDAVLHAVDAATGETAWEFGGWDGVTSFPLVAGEHVYVTGRRGDLYALDRSSGAVAWCARTDTINYGGAPHTLALGEGLLLLAVGGELVALEPGGTPGCRFYETALPRYTTPIEDSSPATAAAARPGGFVPNRGQLPGSVLFASRAGDHALLVRRSGPSLAIAGRDTVELRIRGGRPARSVRPEGVLPGVVNDYSGRDRRRWRAGLRRYGRVRLRGVRPGVDLVVRESRGGRFAYDLVLAQRTDPDKVVLDFRGAGRPSLARDGGLVLHTLAGALRQPPPVAYQRIGGQPVAVAARFRLMPDGGVGFAVGRHDPSRPLVIDPVLEWSTYLGGGVDDEINAISSDAAGNVYVAGRTTSRDLAPAGAIDGWDERNAICEDYPPCYDAFAAKYAPDGSLVHLTHLSGRRDDAAQAIAADGAGNAYVAGFTNSPNFPIHSAFQPDWRCGYPWGDAFVTKLSPTGAALTYSTYLGGCGTFGDIARGIAVDAQGRAVVAGETDAFDFPTTPGAADRTCAPPDGFCRDAFVARVSASGSTLEWSTLFGGNRSDEIPYDVELDAQGRPVIVGETAAWGSKDFPATPGSYDPDPALGFTEAFAARLSSDGSALQWATAFGGIDWDTAYDAALDGDGDVHLAGTTESRDFPTTPGAFDRLCNNDLEEWSCTNHPDAFALELSADGSQLLASTYVGGAGYEEGLGIAVDAAGRSYVAGGSSSSSYTFPLVDAFQSTPRGTHAWCSARADCSEAFLVRLDPAKAHVEYGTFHGGLSQDQARGVTLADGDAWIAGLTHSPDLATTAGAPQPSWAGGNCSFLRDAFEFDPCSDAFIARIDEARPPSPPPPGGGGSGGTPGGTSVSGTSGGTEAPSGGTSTGTARRIERGLTIRIRGRLVVGRVSATAPACARNVPARLERRGRAGWRLRITARTGRDRRFALRLPRTTKPLRVRLPSITRDQAGAIVQCAQASRRIPAS
jgi:outer membrane protein assembly factor BamB